ncbi:MAG: hypothetical protein ABSF28_02955 [Terracidiphilus sp.]
MQTVCSQCKAPMICTKEPGCWCADFPHVLPVPDDPAKGCLCRTCLTAKLETHALSSPEAEVEPKQ